MLATQGRFAVRPLAKYMGKCYLHARNNPMELIMFSQRKLSSPSDRGFVQMIWNAILLVQTRETTSLMTGRNRY